MPALKKVVLKLTQSIVNIQPFKLAQVTTLPALGECS